MDSEAVTEQDRRTSTSGPSTIFGEHTTTREDPIRERFEFFKSHSDVQGDRFERDNRKSMPIVRSQQTAMFADDTSDDTSGISSMVSGNFGGLNIRPIQTPGFNAEKKFSFPGNEGEEDASPNQIDSMSDSGIDEISSMASDFPVFKPRQQKLKRANSEVGYVIGAGDLDDSITSSEMNAMSDDQLSGVDMETQTDPVTTLKQLGVKMKDEMSQTDIVYSQGGFVISSPTKAIKTQLTEEARRLKQERDDSINRLINIERQLDKT